jgi:hypothetical protein
MMPWETIDAFLKANGVRIGAPTKSQTTGGVHEPTSVHKLGRARDYGNVASDCVRVATVLKPYATKAGPIMELFYEGSNTKVWIDNGVPFKPKPKLRDDHRDHVHVALWPGKVMPADSSPPSQPTKEQVMTLVIEPIGVEGRPQNDGGWAVGRRGHVYAYGNGRHMGGWDDPTRNDSSRWCVALVSTASGNGYWLVSNHGEIYAYGDAPQTGNYQIKWGSGVIIGAYRNDRQENGGVTLVRDDDQNLNTYALPA